MIMGRKTFLITGFVVFALLVGSGAWFYSNYLKPRIIHDRLQEVRDLTVAGKNQKAFAVLQQLVQEYPGPRASSNDPRSIKFQADADAAIGADALARHQVALAIQSFVAARSLSPTIDVSADLGLAYALNGDFEKALQILNSGAQQDPKNARIYLVRALVNGRLKNFDNAKQDASKVLQLDPSLKRFLPQSIATHSR